MNEEEQEVKNVFVTQFYLYQLQTNNTESFLNPLSSTIQHSPVRYSNNSNLSSSSSENENDNDNKQCIFLYFIKIASSSVEMLQETIKLQKHIGSLKSELIQIRNELAQEKQKANSNKTIHIPNTNSETSLDIHKILIENEKLKEILSQYQIKQNSTFPTEQMNELTTVFLIIILLYKYIEILLIRITI